MIAAGGAAGVIVGSKRKSHVMSTGRAEVTTQGASNAMDMT